MAACSKVENASVEGWAEQNPPSAPFVSFLKRFHQFLRVLTSYSSCVAPDVFVFLLRSRFLPPPYGPIYDSILRTSEGKLFRWGVEDGDVHPFPTGVCTQIPLPCIEVCCGRKHTVALMKGGFVMSWGTGYFGQLGHGDNASYRHPRLLRRLDPQRLGERVVQVKGCGEVVERLAGVFAVRLNSSLGHRVRGGGGAKAPLLCGGVRVWLLSAPPCSVASSSALSIRRKLSEGGEEPYAVAFITVLVPLLCPYPCPEPYPRPLLCS